MNKDEIEEKYHSFRIEDAKKYGVERAILISNLRMWLDKNLANKSNVKKHDDGNLYYWTFNSASAFEILFPYMTISTIKRHLKWLSDNNVIIVSKFNKSKFDKTNWYTMPRYTANSPIAQNEPSTDQNEPSTDQNELSTAQNEPTIPYINTYINTDIEIPPISPKGEMAKSEDSSYNKKNILTEGDCPEYDQILKIFSDSPRYPKPKSDKVYCRIVKLINEGVINVEDVNVVKEFYKLEKSKEYDKTWHRKHAAITLINNWSEQVDLAYAHKKEKNKLSDQDFFNKYGIKRSEMR